MAGNQLMRQLKKPPSPMELQPAECSVLIPCPVRQVSKVAIRCCTCSKRSVPGSRNEDGSPPFHRTTGPQVGLAYLGSPTLRLRGRGRGRGDFQEIRPSGEEEYSLFFDVQRRFRWTDGSAVPAFAMATWRAISRRHGPTGQRLSRSETRHAPPCPGRSGPDRPLARALGGGTGGRKGQLAGRFPHPTSPISHPNHPQGKSSSASFLFVVTLCWSEATGFHAIPAADQPR